MAEARFLAIIAKKQEELEATPLTFFDLNDDESLKETLAAMPGGLSGQLEAAKSQGFINFEGESLLPGPGDDVQIEITDAGEQELHKTGADPLAEHHVVGEEPKQDEAPEAPPAEAPPAEAPPAEEPAAEAAPAAEPAPATQAEEASAPDEAAPATSEEPAGDQAEEGADGKKWKVDTGYIEHRTQDPNNLAPRRSEQEQEQAVAGAGGGVLGTGVSVTTQKDEDGKWKVDTSYIDRRTQDVDNLQPRRSGNSQLGGDEMAAHSVTTKKDEEGKWTVDTSYVKNKTADTALIREDVAATEGGPASFSTTTKKDGEGKWTVDTSYVKNKTLDTALLREDLVAGTKGDVASFSATTQKDGEGKWKVDTSYVQHRSMDVTNLEKKLETKAASQFADFETTKFTYQELIDEWSKEQEARTLNLDPANREKYLSDEECQTIFGMSPSELSAMPKWKRDKIKKEKKLF